MPRVRLLLNLLVPGRAYRYGSEHRCQRAELHLPAGPGPHPVVVTIHGGSWATGVSKIVMRGLARDLVRRGYAVWNIEYRRVGRGHGGGWPLTFADVAAAIDHLPNVDAPIDLDHVTMFGHSAGGQLRSGRRAAAGSRRAHPGRTRGSSRWRRSRRPASIDSPRPTETRRAAPWAR